MLFYVQVAIGIVFLIALFMFGFYFGKNYRPRKLSPEDFSVLGEDFEINMRNLMDENKEHVRRWESMSLLLSSMGVVKDRAKLSDLVTRLLRDEMKADFSAVLLHSEKVFKPAAIEGLHVECEDVLTFPVEDPLITYIYNFPQAVHLDSTKREFAHFTKLREKIHEIIIMPMKVGEEVLGLLWVARKKKKKGNVSFTPGEKAVITYMGNVLGYLMKNLELISRLQERAFKIVSGLAKALEQKDEYTKGHSERVTSYAVLFSKHIGVSKEDIEIIERAALLHDIGKIGIPDRILNKPSKLTDEEFEFIKSHPLFGAELLKVLGFLKDELILILHHHEKFDGTGYPYGLKTSQIPRGAAIISLADVFDALTTDRPYRKAFSIEKSLQIMEEMKGQNFDPTMLDQFLAFVKSRLNSTVASR